MFFKKGYQIEPKTDASLPKTRKELFRTILKENFALLFDVGLTVGLFSLPLYLLFFFLQRTISLLEDRSAQSIFPLLFWVGMIALPFFALRGLGMGSVHELLKKRAFGEGFGVLDTILVSIRKNAGRYLIIELLRGLFFELFALGSIYLLLTPLDSIGKGIAIGILLLLFFLVWITGEFAYLSNPIYENNLRALLKNGFLFTCLSFFPSLLFFLLSFALPISISLVFPYLLILVLFLYISIGEGILLCIATLYAHSQFDKFINEKYYPDVVRRGLLNETELQMEQHFNSQDQ